MEGRNKQTAEVEQVAISFANIEHSVHEEKDLKMVQVYLDEAQVCELRAKLNELEI